jgi:tetratricopeptide (TPR) repeat protein
MEKYPKSKLQVYIVTSYQTMLFEYSNANDNAKLEAAAEAWLKFFPNDLQTIAYVAEATRKLVRDQKFIEYGLKVYAQKPTPAYAYYLYDAYKRVKDAAKQTEWCLKLLEYPEFNDNFHLRMELVSQYAEKDLPKAAEYAQQALRALRLAKKPDNTPEAKWADAVSFVEKECSNIIGMSLYNQGKFGEAIKYLESALKVKQYDAGYYYIAMSQWKLQQVEDAILSFAKADLMKGELQAKAKKYCEDLYRDTHNGNTTGIEKTYKKAQAELSAGRT